MKGIIAKFCWDPVGIYLLKVNNRNTRASCEICSELTVKTPERGHYFSVSIVNFEQVIADWGGLNIICHPQRGIWWITKGGGSVV